MKCKICLFENNPVLFSGYCLKCGNNKPTLFEVHSQQERVSSKDSDSDSKPSPEGGVLRDTEIEQKAEEVVAKPNQVNSDVNPSALSIFNLSKEIIPEEEKVITIDEVMLSIRKAIEKKIIFKLPEKEKKNE